MMSIYLILAFCKQSERNFALKVTPAPAQANPEASKNDRKKIGALISQMVIVYPQLRNIKKKGDHQN
jgi:hypothetical protein